MYPIGYNENDLNTLLRSSDFDTWLSRLADQKAKARILARITSPTFGNFSDCEPVGEGVSEMRVHVGAGYRVYYTRTGSTVYVLRAGGVKASQTKDIAKAKKMAREFKRGKKTRREGKQLTKHSTRLRIFCPARPRREDRCRRRTRQLGKGCRGPGRPPLAFCAR